LGGEWGGPKGVEILLWVGAILWGNVPICKV